MCQQVQVHAKKWPNWTLSWIYRLAIGMTRLGFELPSSRSGGKHFILYTTSQYSMCYTQQNIDHQTFSHIPISLPGGLRCEVYSKGTRNISNIDMGRLYAWKFHNNDQLFILFFSITIKWVATCLKGSNLRNISLFNGWIKYTSYSNMIEFDNESHSHWLERKEANFHGHQNRKRLIQWTKNQTKNNVITSTIIELQTFNLSFYSRGVNH